METAVPFATSARVHVAIAVGDLEASLPFYRALFAAEPDKKKPGYARFALADPPVNFTLNQATRGRGHVDPEHLGIQVKSSAEVGRARARMDAAGIATLEERAVVCCHALQDKFWAVDPDGHRWEVFVTGDDAPAEDEVSAAAEGCCTVAPGEVAAVTEVDGEPCCAPGCCAG